MKMETKLADYVGGEPTTFSELFEQSIRSFGPLRFIVPADDGDVFTYQKFGAMVHRMARRLVEMGLAPNRRIAILLPNGAPFFAVFSAVSLAGSVPVLCGPATTNEELLKMCLQAGVTALITTGVDAERRGKLDGIEVIEISAIDVEKKPERAFAPAKQDPDAVAYIIFSGGTTGKPKGCMVSQRNMASELFSLRRTHGLPNECVHLCVLPLHHASALYRSLLIPFSQGSTIVIAREFAVAKFWDWIDQFAVGFVQVVPTIITVLLEHPKNPTARARESLHFIGSASGPLNASTITKFEKRFGVLIAAAYGLTEAACGVFFNDPRNPARRVDSVGRPIDIARVIIRDESGNPLPPNNLGEIVISGPMISMGFLEKDDSEGRLVGDTLYTGDLGYFDDNGYLVIEGRKVDFIHRSGFKISPREVEEALNDLPHLHSAAVFGVPQPILGEDVIAYVRWDDAAPFREHALRQALRGKLAPYKIPSRIFRITDGFSSEDFKQSRSFYRSAYLEKRQQLLATPQRRVRGKPHPGKPHAFLWGETVYLRPFLEADQKNSIYLSNLTNPEVHQLTHSGRFPQNETMVKAFWESLKPPNGLAFAACDLATDTHIGNVILKIDWIARSAEFGRFFFREYQNPLYAQESLHLVMQYVFEDLCLDRLWGGGANPASLPSIIRLGFILEGRMRKHDFMRGERRDKFIVGMLADEYRDIKNGGKPARRTQHYDVPEDIMKALGEVLADAFAIDPSIVTSLTSPAEVTGWDSLGLIVLWNILEEKFQVTLESSDMVAVTCVGDIALAIESKLPTQPANRLHVSEILNAPRCSIFPAEDLP